MTILKHLNTISSTGRNEKGRTPFVKHKIIDGKIKTFHGEHLDSAEDEKRIERINRDMEEVHREHLTKQYLSEQLGEQIILTA